MKISAIRCDKCHDTIYSRAVHDYRSCSCGDIAIDGGFDYTRTIFKTEAPKLIELDLDVSKQILYEDWNNKKDVYGLIKSI